MIHYITVGVALERPPTTDQYRRYAIYGGLHDDAELVALQMASCTSTMPVSVERTGCYGDGPCAMGTPIDPHGVMGCRCWPSHSLVASDIEGEKWLLDEHCPYHGTDDA